MTAAILDTLQIAKKAKEAGFSESQAEFYAENIVDLLDSQIATKADIKGLEQDLKNMGLETSFKLAELKNDIIKWIIGLALSQTALLITLLKMMH